MKKAAPCLAYQGAIPVTVQLTMSISPAGGYGGWLYGEGVTSSATSVKVFVPITDPRSGIVCTHNDDCVLTGTHVGVARSPVGVVVAPGQLEVNVAGNTAGLPVVLVRQSHRHADHKGYRARCRDAGQLGGDDILSAPVDKHRDIVASSICHGQVQGTVAIKVFDGDRPWPMIKDP